MGHNVSSHKVLVASPTKTADTKDTKRIGNGTNAVKNVNKTSLNGAPGYIKKCKEYNVKVNEDSRICDITGCCGLSDGSIVMTDFSNKCLKKLNTKGQVSFINLPDKPSDIYCLSDSENKVIVCGANSLHFVNVKGKMKLAKSLKLKHNCNGLCVHDGSIYIVDDKSVMQYTMSGEKKGTIYNSSKSKLCHIAISANGSNLYVTDENSGLLTIDKTGKLLATITDQELREAQGLCTDTDGNIFVSGFESDTVIKIDSGGKTKLETVIPDNGEISDPKCLCFDKQNRKLYVGQWNDTLAVFDIK